MAIKRVGIVGSGIMGSDIAEVAARAGIEVVLRSRAQSTADAMVAALEKSLAKQVERGKLDPAVDTDDQQGDFSPINGGGGPPLDGVIKDYEERYDNLIRLSNLLTTRSDTFTCYVYVMGVLHDGTPSAELKVQRRVAFIADRSGVRPLRPVVRTQFFNNE